MRHHGDSACYQHVKPEVKQNVARVGNVTSMTPSPGVSLLYKCHVKTLFVHVSRQGIICTSITSRHYLYKSHVKTLFVQVSRQDIICTRVTSRHYLYKCHVKTLFLQVSRQDIISTSVTSRHYPYTSFTTVITRQRITHIVLPEDLRFDHNVAVLVEVHTLQHLHYNYSTTVLLQL